MKFGLMFLPSSEQSLVGDKYRLVIESARFGDKRGFSSVWVQERHINRFESLYPNPTALQAALAKETKHIHLRDGSVVLPVHQPIRAVETWSMLDNLSAGRVGISLASGWSPNDFVSFPGTYQDHRDLLVENLNHIQHLWQGQSFQSNNAVSQHVYPRPVQKHLPMWMTAAGNPNSFEVGGQSGCHLLTHLLDQSIEDLAENIAIYRKARQKAGFDPTTGMVTVMLPTFVGEQAETVRNQSRHPYCEYLKANIGLLKGLAQSCGANFDINGLSGDDFDQFLGYLYDRFASERGLIGTPETCAPLVRKLAKIGVNEVSCLLDFGPSTDSILGNLIHLERLHQLIENSHTESRQDAFDLGDNNGIYDDDTYAKPQFLNAVEPKEETLEEAPTLLQPDSVDVSRLKSMARRELDSEEFYASLTRWGIEFDASFQGVRHLWIGKSDSLGLVRFRDDLLESESGYQFHPAFLDACFQVFVGTLLAQHEDEKTEGLFLPVGFNSFQAFAPPQTEVWSYARLHDDPKMDPHNFEGDIQIFGKDGELLALVAGMRLQHVDGLTADMDQPALDEYLYEVNWELSPIPQVSEPIPRGTWLIFADHRGMGDALARQLNARGDTTILAKPGDRFRQLDAQTYCLNPAQDTDIREFLDLTGIGTQQDLRGIVHLWSLDAVSTARASVAELEVAQVLGISSALNIVQHISEQSAQNPPPMWLVTKGAQSRGADEVVALAQAPIWGWARSLPHEYPNLRRTLVDLDPEASTEESATSMIRALDCRDDEDQIIWRKNLRHVARLQPKPLLESRPFAWRPDGSYLVTGGLGSLGMHMTAFLVKQGVRQILLTGRSAPSDTVLQQLEDYRSQGVDVWVIRGDISEESTVAELVRTIELLEYPLRGVVHAAGVNGQKLMADMNRDDLWTMFNPKVRGTWLLFEGLKHLDLDFFLMLSSLSNIRGVKGLSHYAAANYFLDAFAYYGRQLGLPTVTVNLGPVGDGGMAVAGEGTQQILQRMGLHLMPPAVVMDSLTQILSHQICHRILAAVDWDLFKRTYEAGNNSRLLEHLRSRREETSKEAVSFLDTLEASPVPERFDMLVTHIRQIAARTMKLRGTALPDPEKGFFDLGMDSLMVSELKTRLQESMNLKLEATVAIEHATVNALARFLLDQIQPPETESAEGMDDLQQLLTDEKTSIAEEVSQLSDAELAALIDEEIGDLTP